MSYKELELWKLARDLSIVVHRMTLSKPPQFEMYELGGKIRRASKSARAAIMEGHGRRRYKNDFAPYLTCALASNRETTDHLETLYQTKSLTGEHLFNDLSGRLASRGYKLNRFIQMVDNGHNSPK
ncbi:MAG: four helix bundle protein [Chitinivibrionales bacterium]|nr:four helix bundle protein [Chitinivibrionales bacterium]MBD3394232.1 four helix bundle protein [Chitinivibrionales bacterium]